MCGRMNSGEDVLTVQISTYLGRFSTCLKGGREERILMKIKWMADGTAPSDPQPRQHC